jgi:hypothetical protein
MIKDIINDVLIELIFYIFCSAFDRFDNLCLISADKIETLEDQKPKVVELRTERTRLLRFHAYCEM